MRVLCLSILHHSSPVAHPPAPGTGPGDAALPAPAGFNPAGAGRRPGAPSPPTGEEYCARPFEAVLEILDRFSPIVEASATARGKAFLDVTGTEKLFGPPADLAGQVTREVLRETGIRSRAAVAGSKFVAGVAAPLASAGPLVVPAGREQRFLAPLPVELLPISPEALSWLRRLGLRRLGQVATLPQNALASQLGAEGMMAHRLANGIDREPVVPRPRTDILEETLSFEAPPESLEALLAALDKLLDRLVPRLRKRFQVCGELKLCFICDAAESRTVECATGDSETAKSATARFGGVRPRPDSVNLKIPLDSKPEIMGILKRHLEAAALPEGVSEIRLAMARLSGETGRQKPLSSATRRRQEEALQRLEKDLAVRFGHGSLKKVVEIDPGSRIPERRMALVDAAGEEQS